MFVPSKAKTRIPKIDTFLIKQEIYFVKENYEMFSTEVSARGKQEQNSGGPHKDSL